MSILNPFVSAVNVYILKLFVTSESSGFTKPPIVTLTVFPAAKPDGKAFLSIILVSPLTVCWAHVQVEVEGVTEVSTHWHVKLAVLILTLAG